MSRLKVLYGFHAVTARVRADASTIEEILYDPTRKDQTLRVWDLVAPIGMG